MSSKCQQIFLGFCLLAMPALAAAVPAKSDLQCESLAENSVLCAGGGAGEASKSTKTSAESSGSKASGLVSRADVSGETLSLDHEFELNTVLGDRTAVPEDSRFSSLAAGQKAAGSVRNLEIMMQAAGAFSSNTRVGIAAKK